MDIIIIDPRKLIDELLRDNKPWGIEQIAIDFFELIKDRSDDALQYYKWLYNKDKENYLSYIYNSKSISNLRGISVIRKSKNYQLSEKINYTIII